MGRPLAVIAWLVVVLACSTGVWAVISSAGEEVATSREVVPRPVPLPTAPGTTGRSPSPPGPRTPSTTASPSTTGGGDREESTPSARPTRDPSTRDVDPTPSARPDREVRRTWDSAAGSLVVACRGGSITFGGAHANPGWSLEVDDRGPEEVQVEFESSGEADDVRVEATCVGGQPQFSD
jgi:hypothetical protein